MRKENDTSQRRAGMSETVPIADLSQNSIPGPHWTSTRYSKNILMDALVKHTLGLTLYGMSDLGEVLEVVGQLKPGDEERWINAWSAMAKRLQYRAEEAERAEKRVTASTAYLRASTYWRVSLMYFSQPNDSRIKEHARASSECYERYIELSGYPGQYVEIPYENSFLPGHFYRSPVAGDKAPLLIITPGQDTWAEDTRWVYDGAIRRGSTVWCMMVPARVCIKAQQPSVSTRLGECRETGGRLRADNSRDKSVEDWSHGFELRWFSGTAGRSLRETHQSMHRRPREPQLGKFNHHCLTNRQYLTAP